MSKPYGLATGAIQALVVSGGVLLFYTAASEKPNNPTPRAPRDAVVDAQTPREVPVERPEQKKTAHDLSDIFAWSKAVPSSEALIDQPEKGGSNGFDLYRDPQGAMKPGTTFEDRFQAAVAEKPNVMARQRKLLESRYILEPRLDPTATMSRGKPLAVGPTVRLPKGMDWEKLAAMSPAEIGDKDVFPYKALPHPVQGGGLGGQVFPPMQIKMFPRLERYDVEFDLPESFLPEFPPAMYLQNRPELGDVSRGEVVSINNYYRLFKDLLTPVQLDGMRLLVTPFAQEEFNPTDDRKCAEPSLGVTCLDCHVNGHTSGQFHISPDARPEQRRMRLDTVSLRGVFNQHIHGSKRSLRSVEDFTEFEQRTAYFNGDADSCDEEGNEFPGSRPGNAHGPDAEHVRFPARAETDAAWAARRHEGYGERAARREAVLRQGAVRRLPPGAVLPRSPDARPAPGALPEGGSG